MAHKTVATRNDKYDTETIMTQVNSIGFIYRTEGNSALIDVLMKAELLVKARGIKGRYEKRVKVAK